VDSSDAAGIQRIYFTISGLYTLAASLIWGVNTLFLLDAGLNLFETFVANAFFTAGMVIFEIPTGVFADTRGRRFSFMVSNATVALGTLGYVWAAAAGAGVITFSLISVFLGLGYTFYSGAVEAWLVDALQARGFEGNLDSVFARGGIVTGAAMLIGTVGGGLLGDINLAVPFVVRAVLLIVGLVVAAWGMRDLGFSPRTLRLTTVPAEMAKVARESIAGSWRVPAIRRFLGVSVIEVGVLFWAWYAWQPYILELAAMDAVWLAGVVAAIAALSIMAGNALVSFFSRYCTKRTTLLVWAHAVRAAALVGFGLVDNPVLAVAVFSLVGASLGVAGPVKQAYLHQVIATEQRASVISFDSMVGNIGGVGGQIGLGALSNAVSIPAGYVTCGAVQILSVPLILAIRRLQDSVDHITGTKAGVDSSCAAQGLPEVTGIDSKVYQPAAVGD